MYNYQCDNSREGKAECLQKTCNKEPSLKTEVRESLFGETTLKLRPEGSVVSPVKTEASPRLGRPTPEHLPLFSCRGGAFLVALLPGKDKKSVTQ